MAGPRAGAGRTFPRRDGGGGGGGGTNDRILPGEGRARRKGNEWLDYEVVTAFRATRRQNVAVAPPGEGGDSRSGGRLGGNAGGVALGLEPRPCCRDLRARASGGSRAHSREAFEPGGGEAGFELALAFTRFEGAARPT